MKKKQRRRTTRVGFTCAGVPHLSNASEVAHNEQPFDDEQTTAEVWALAAEIRANGLELVRRGKGRQQIEIDDLEE